MRRFKNLLKQADREGFAATQDAQAVKRHAEEYQTALREAELHGDRHEQLWHEAQECAPSCQAQPCVPWEPLATCVLCTSCSGAT